MLRAQQSSQKETELVPRTDSYHVEPLQFEEKCN